MKMFTCILIIILLAFPGKAESQHYIGKHKTEVRDQMRKNDKDLHEDTSSKNSLYNMVKYIDNNGMQTLIYVFTDQDICSYSKWMCDYSMLNKVLSELNKSYDQSAENSWRYSHEGSHYLVTLKTGDWFFTITTKPEVKE